MKITVAASGFDLRRVLAANFYLLLSASLSGTLAFFLNSPSSIALFYLPGVFFGGALHLSWYGFKKEKVENALKLVFSLGWTWLGCLLLSLIATRLLGPSYQLLTTIPMGIFSGCVTFEVACLRLPFESTLKGLCLAMMASVLGLAVAFYCLERIESIPLLGQYERPVTSFYLLFLVWQLLVGNVICREMRKQN